MEESRFLSVKDVAHQLRCSQSHVRALIASGELRGCRLASRVLVRRETFEQWVSRSAEPVEPRVRSASEARG